MPIFLANAFLFFGLVAILPVLMHLLHRKQPKPVLFAAMRFLQEAITKSRRSRRITQCLTLLMRVLIILLLAAAFAQPVVKFSRYMPGNQRTLIMVLDSSASMQAMENGRTLFEAAREWALQLLSTLEDGDRIALLTPGAPSPETIFPPVSDRAAVQATLQELKPAYGEGDLCTHLTLLLSKNPDAFKNSELHLFSDFQRNCWPQEEAEPLTAKLHELGAALFLNRAGMVTTGDLGIAKAEYTPPAIIGNARLVATATLHANNQAVGSAILHLEHDGQELNHAALDVMPGENTRATVTAEDSGDSPQFCGLLHTDDDAFALNNRHYFSLAQVKAVEVLLVQGSAPSDTFFLKHALAPGGQATSLMQPRELDWNSFLATETSDARAVFVCNPPPLDEAALAKLDALLSIGCELLLFPGDGNGMTQESLRHFTALQGMTFTRNDRPEADKLEIALAETDSPLAKRIGASLPPPWSFPARCTLDINLPPGTPGALLLQGRHAFLTMHRQGNGRLWLFGTAANRQWSDWAVTPSFLVCMQVLAKELAHTALPALETRIGSPLALAWNGHSTTQEFTVTAPNFSVTRLSLTRGASTQPYLFQSFDTPGIHTISDGSQSLQVAINLPDQECALDYAGEAQLLASAGKLPCAYTTGHSQLMQRISELRQGSPLWPLLLCLAFFLSIFELLFANLRSRAIESPRLVKEILDGQASMGGAK